MAACVVFTQTADGRMVAADGIHLATVIHYALTWRIVDSKIEQGRFYIVVYYTIFRALLKSNNTSPNVEMRRDA